MASGCTKRYWGEDVAGVTGSLSLHRLHQLARERSALRTVSAEEDSVAEEMKEVEEELPMVTQSMSAGRSEAVHHKLPDWVTRPQLVSADIAGASAPLSSLQLPDVVSTNLQSMGFSTFFPVQLEVLSHLMTHSSPLPPRDLCICAPTGCGKTLCYVVPIVTALLDCIIRQVRCVVVVPSRPLAKQVLSVFSQVAVHSRVRCGLLCGDSPMEKEAALLADHKTFPASSHVDIVIATPGRLAEHLLRGSFVSLQFLRFLVIDEADKLLSQQIHSWLPLLLQCQSIPISQPETTPTSLSKLGTWLGSRSELPYSFSPPSSPSYWTPGATNSILTADQFLLPKRKHIQKLLLSATMTQDPEALAMLTLHRPLLFSVAVPTKGRETMSLAPPPSLQEFAVPCQASLKPLILLFLLLQELGMSVGSSLKPPAAPSHSILCFTNSKDTAQRLKVVLEHFNLLRVVVVTSKTPAEERRRGLSQFARGEIKVLVCSDALARGMDLPDCGCVINYDPPSVYRSYLHRVGRTARAGATGRAFSLLSTGEELTAFRRMLRVARRPKMKEEDVTPELLEPLRAQYELALEALKETVIYRC